MGTSGRVTGGFGHVNLNREARYARRCSLNDRRAGSSPFIVFEDR